MRSIDWDVSHQFLVFGKLNRIFVQNLWDTCELNWGGKIGWFAKYQNLWENDVKVSVGNSYICHGVIMSPYADIMWRLNGHALVEMRKGNKIDLLYYYIRLSDPLWRLVILGLFRALRVVGVFITCLLCIVWNCLKRIQEILTATNKTSGMVISNIWSQISFKCPHATCWK